MARRAACVKMLVYEPYNEAGDCTPHDSKLWVSFDGEHLDFFKTARMESKDGFSIRLTDLMGAIARAAKK